MKVWLLLLLVLILAAATPVCNQTDYADFYFDLCLADPLCQEALDLHSHERALFSNLLSSVLLTAMHLSPEEMCYGGNFTAVWLGVITGFPFCQWNQVPDSELGCICRGDRLCEALHPSKFSLDRIGLYAAVFVALVIIVYALLSVTKDSRDNRKRWAEQLAQK